VSPNIEKGGKTMPDNLDPFDDDLGPDPLDRGSGKVMGSGGSGGGSMIDPAYDEAMRILGRAHALPSPIVQTALMMDDADGAELAAQLTALRRAAGVTADPFFSPTLGASPTTATTPGEAVQAFIAALQESPPDQTKLGGLHQQIVEAGGDVQAALERVCAYPAVQAKLGN
jgi:hypothetical protein